MVLEQEVIDLYLAVAKALNVIRQSHGGEVAVGAVSTES